MHYKTAKLLNLFPDAYATGDSAATLYQLLDALGAELMEADDAIKVLLKSHWVGYAEGRSLDGLGSAFGVQRRRLRRGLRLFSQGLGWVPFLDRREMPDRLLGYFRDRQYPLSSQIQVVVQEPSFRWLVEDAGDLRAYAIRRETDATSGDERLQVYLVSETDEAFRLRLKSIIRMLAGGGTRSAIRGAVRAALGMPYDLAQLNIPPRFKALQEAIDQLIRIEEFSPEVDRLIGNQIVEVDQASQITLAVEPDSVLQVVPQIRWTFTQGGGRLLSLERLGSGGAGVRTLETFLMPEGSTLVLSPEADGTLSARLDGYSVKDAFTNLDGSTPARLPEIPRERSEWRFRAAGGQWDISTFDDGDIFELPTFIVELRWERRQPLTFDVFVPYFFEAAVQQIQEQYGYQQDIFIFEGLPREHLQAVVNQTKAAGVRGNVQFSLNFFDTHDQQERFRLEGIHTTTENQTLADTLEVGSFNREMENHEMVETFVIGGVFDVSTFDGSFGFQE
ncbi:MAG: hypothetical protein ACHWZW_20905 [Spirulina sp.]